VIYADSQSDFEKARQTRALSYALGFEFIEFLNGIVSSKEIEYVSKAGEKVRTDIHIYDSVYGSMYSSLGGLGRLRDAKDWTVGKSSIAFYGDEVYVKKMGNYTVSAIVSGNKTRFLVAQGAGLGILGDDYIIQNGGFLDDKEKNTLVIYAESESDFEKARRNRALGSALGFEFIGFLNETVSSKKIEYVSKTGKNVSVDINSLGSLKEAPDWTVGKSNIAFSWDEVYTKKIGNHTISAIVSGDKTRFLVVEGAGLGVLGDEYNIQDGGFLDEKGKNALVIYADSESDFEKAIKMPEISKSIGLEFAKLLNGIVSSKEIEYVSKTGKNVGVNINNLGSLKEAKDWAVGKSNFASTEDEVYVKKIGNRTLSAIVSGDETRFLVVEGAGLGVLGDEYNIQNGGFLDNKDKNIFVVYAESENDFEEARKNRVLGSDLMDFLRKIVRSGKVEYITKTGRPASAEIEPGESLGALAMAKDWTLGKSRFSVSGDRVYVKKIGQHTITAIVRESEWVGNQRETILLTVEGPGIELLGKEWIVPQSDPWEHSIGGFLGGGLIEGVYVIYAAGDNYSGESIRFQWLEFIYKYGSNGYETLDKDVVAEVDIEDFNEIFKVIMFGQKIDNHAFRALNTNHRYWSETVTSGEYKGLTVWSDDGDYSRIFIKNGMPLFIEGTSFDDGENGYAYKFMNYVKNNSIRIYVDPKNLYAFIINTKLYAIRVRYNSEVIRLQNPLAPQKAQTSAAQKPAAKKAAAAKK
jgi:hypothetical protein